MQRYRTTLLPRLHRLVLCNESLYPWSSQLLHRPKPDHQRHQPIRIHRQLPSSSELPPAGGWWCCRLFAAAARKMRLTASSSGSARSVLFDSPRPVGLQRMFEHHTGKSADSATDFKSADSASAGFASTALSSADSYSRDSDPGVPNFETTGSSYDATANTITFSSPTVQREPEAAPRRPSLRPPRRRPQP